MVNFRQDGDLIVSEFWKFGGVFEFLHVHHFYRIKLFRLLILALVDIPVLPLSYFL